MNHLPTLSPPLGIICLPGGWRRNMLDPMADSAQATVTTTGPNRPSQKKVIIIKIIILTAISLGLGFTHSWASTRYYQPDYVAGFGTGMLEGALMPAALPGLVGERISRFMRQTIRARPTRSATFWGLTPAARFSSASPSGNRGGDAEICNWIKIAAWRGDF